jgi:hypothetical protein
VVQIEHAQYSLSGTEWATVSPLAKHFIRSLMNLDIAARLDVQGAIMHPWMREYVSRHPSADPSATSLASDNSVAKLVSPLKDSLQVDKAVPALTGGVADLLLHAPDSITPTPEDVSAMVSAEGEASQGGSVAAGGVISLVNSSDIGGDTTFSSIFWSNKASLIKLTSLRKKNTTEAALALANGSSEAVVESTRAAAGFPVAVFNGPNSVSPSHAVAASANESRKASFRHLSPATAHQPPQPGKISAKKTKRRIRSAFSSGQALSNDEIEAFSDDSGEAVKSSNVLQSQIKHGIAHKKRKQLDGRETRDEAAGNPRQVVTTRVPNILQSTRSPQRLPHAPNRIGIGRYFQPQSAAHANVLSGNKTVTSNKSTESIPEG